MMSSVSTSVATPAHSATVDAAARAEVAARLRYGVTRLARVLRQQSDTGLTPTQLAALATIARCGPMPIGALAEEEQVGAPTATKVVDKLHARGYVDRVADGDDRRVKRVALSAAGETFLSDVRDRKTAWLSTRLAELPDTEVAVLSEALTVLEHLAAPPPSSAGPTP